VQRRGGASRGYSLMELLVVVAIISVVALITVPALMQLMPQYRIRSAASETAAAVRMIRQRAVTTRSPWRISFDLTRNRYRYYALKQPNLSLSVATNWTSISRDGVNPAPGSETWVNIPSVQLKAPTGSFKDVVCPADGVLDLIFLRDGSVADKAACSGGSVLTFTAATTTAPATPALLFSVDNSYVRFNRYYLSLAENGTVTITPKKE
jgi:prepilin-type N-terminal cleavage/methylation domain-containing protein